MTVIRLPLAKGCLLYSPVLDDDHQLVKIHKFLETEDLLPVRYIACPTPQHHLCLREYRQAFPEAIMFCTETRGGVMAPLHKRRRDLDFDFILHPAGSATSGTEAIEWAHPTVRSRFQADEKKSSKSLCNIDEHREELKEIFDLFLVEDNRTTELVFIHKESGVLIISDLLYKTSSSNELKGPGGTTHRYTFPKWFAQGQEDLFYKLDSDNSNGLLPAYRTHPMYRKIDMDACRKAIERLLEFIETRQVKKCIACHTDPICGQDSILETIKRAWAFLW